MKNILMVLVISSLTMSSGNAWSRDVRSDVMALGSLAMGVQEHSIKGQNAKEIFQNYIDEQYGEGEQPLVFKEIGDMAQGDEVDAGFTSTKSAIELSTFAEGMLEETLDGLDSDSEAEKIKDLKAKIYDLNHNWAPLINRLDRQGVKFGYTGNGPGYCGVSFVEMIIIDEKEQKVYEVYLSESGEC